MGSFGDSLHAFAEHTGESLEDTRKGVTIKLFSAIIKDTPVDSGRLRGNWQASRNTSRLSRLQKKDKSGSIVISQLEKTINASAPKDTLIMRNNLPYVQRIEFDGWSKVKAPRGMVRRNVARFKRLLDQEVRKNKV
jgi:hypothetical protein